MRWETPSLNVYKHSNTMKGLIGYKLLYCSLIESKLPHNVTYGKSATLTSDNHQRTHTRSKKQNLSEAN